jgi:hypothetical protein
MDDIKDLDKKQLILLTLLITFVVSIGTGIVTVSLMKQMPKSVPQTINNVIQRTIEKVSTVEVPTTTTNTTLTNSTTDTATKGEIILGGSDALVNIYLNNVSTVVPTSGNTTTSTTGTNETAAIGQGIIISDIGLILVDSSILTDQGSYKVVLNKTEFSASILKKFGNGFTVMKISPMTDKTNTPEPAVTTPKA